MAKTQKNYDVIIPAAILVGAVATGALGYAFVKAGEGVSNYCRVNECEGRSPAPRHPNYKK